MLALVEKLTWEVYTTRTKTKNSYKCNSVILKLAKKFNLAIKLIMINNEHINSIIRRFYKKDTNFSLIGDDEIEQVQDEINNMPREMFAWKGRYQIETYFKNKWFKN